jgi:hypothetical protein
LPPVSYAPEAEILGEATLDRDGVLHGWCWNPRLPTARLAVEFLVDNVVVATTTASRFREDVRNRNFGDGYHGFNIALTKQLSGPTPPRMVAAREAETSRVFWQALLGDFAIPAGLHDRMAAADAAIGAAAWAQALVAPRGGRLAMAAAGLGIVGRRLQAKADHRAAANPAALAGASVMLPHVVLPSISLILDAGVDARRTLALIAAAAGTIAGMAAELIILDQGGDPRAVYLAGQVTNARYFFNATPGAAARNMAAAQARGGTLVFLRNTGRRFGVGLGQLAAALAHNGPISSSAIASRIGPARFISSPDASCLGLDLAISRAAYLAAGGFAEHLDDDSAAADLLLRCLRDDEKAMIWREPPRSDSPTFASAESTHGF